METASSPILYTLRFRGGGGGGATSTSTHAASTAKLYYRIHSKRPCGSSLLASPGNCRCYNFCGKFHKRLQIDRLSCGASSINSAESDQSQKFAVLIEVEGVLMDVYRLCNRQAFNEAFKKLGLDCANWSEPVYLDLLRIGKNLTARKETLGHLTKDRRSVGDEERMLILYFNRIGWPTSVATSEKGTFMKNVLREKKNAVDDLVMSNAFSLRPGAEEFVDEASEEGVPVAILTAYSISGEKAARSIVEKLGTDRISKIKIIGDDEVKQSFYGQLVFGKGVSSSLDEQLAQAVNKAASAEKQRVAEEVASMLKLKVELNTTSSESFQNIVAALRAGAEMAEVPIYNCVLVAGSQSGVAAAERIGMPCVVLRSSSTSRAEFRSAIAVMDGFGGADLTISRLRKKLFP
ncbi:Haloacid dehalogenase-like hydrolase superfamily protein [Perilla frutescens var. hirtella]|uniref:Haloacid dehalogenase-like hydrolase superfamily protein n=1 Tax=Perilla frutescens var. hirtella TaxID=608512 RepID=A0AAD4J539_PERFH|nr:Haloacid dehalogenase-like hydrolase superfamily protein [Perilla frutescens var. hirtella]